MYGIFTYIYHTNQPNVGKYTLHGSCGSWYTYIFQHTAREPLKTPHHLEKKKQNSPSRSRMQRIHSNSVSRVIANGQVLMPSPSVVWRSWRRVVMHSAPWSKDIYIYMDFGYFLRWKLLLLKSVFCKDVKYLANAGIEKWYTDICDLYMRREILSWLRCYSLWQLCRIHIDTWQGTTMQDDWFPTALCIT